MAAALRGGSASSTKPRAKSATKAAKRPDSAKSAPPQGYSPAKLGAAKRVGLSPRIAVAVACGVALVGLLAGLLPEHRLQGIAATMGVGFDRQLAGLGLKVNTLTVQGASPMAQADIIRASGVYRDQPIMGVDLEAMRRAVEQVGWVKQARVVRLLPDTIVIAVTERPLLAVWQHNGRTGVIDADGRLIAEADPGRFADLPLVVGEGANDGAAAILPLVRGHPRLMQRLDALVRVDDRRWDLRLKDGGIVQLPAVGEDSALIQLDQMDQKSRLLELGFARIDLRDPELVAVRPRETSPSGQLVSNGA